MHARRGVSSKRKAPPAFSPAFASAGVGEETAPGQIAARILRNVYRIEQVDAYGNLTHIVTVEAPHRELRIVVEGVADMDVERSTQKAYVAGEISPLAFLAPTALTRSDAHLRELAERHLGKHLHD